MQALSALFCLASLVVASLCVPLQKSSDCSSEGALFADSTDCNSYYKCENGQAVRLQCAQDQHWNSASSSCDTVENAACKAEEDSEDSSASDSLSSSESNSNSESNSLSSSSEEDGDGDCPADSNPPACPARDSFTTVFFAHPDSHWFYECSNGRAYCRNCPSTLVWNQQCNACDWPGQNNCASIKRLITKLLSQS